MEAALTPIRSQASSRGCPRKFDIDHVLDKAIPVFCERGFHGASLNDLAAGMQLTQGSIYKAFRDMRGILLAARDRQEALYSAKLRKTVTKAGSGYQRLHAALDFRIKDRADLSEGDHPSRDAFKTKAEVVKFVRERVAGRSVSDSAAG